MATVCQGRRRRRNSGAVAAQPRITIVVEAVFEATPNAALTVGSRGEIRFVNSHAQSLFGRPRRELIGRPVEVLVPEPARDQHVHHRAEFVADPVPRPLYLRTDLRARRKDGSEFPAWVGPTAIETQAGALVLATVVDRLEG